MIRPKSGRLFHQICIFLELSAPFEPRLWINIFHFVGFSFPNQVSFALSRAQTIELRNSRLSRFLVLSYCKLLTGFLPPQESGGSRMPVRGPRLDLAHPNFMQKTPQQHQGRSNRPAPLSQGRLVAVLADHVGLCMETVRSRSHVFQGLDRGFCSVLSQGVQRIRFAVSF